MGAQFSQRLVAAHPAPTPSPQIDAVITLAMAAERASTPQPTAKLLGWI